MAPGPALARAHLYVSPRGRDANRRCARARPCRTIAYAARAAGAHDVVDVAPGSYRGGIVIDKDLTLVGRGRVIVDAAGHGRGFELVGQGAAGSTIAGFVVENATYEGILALRTARVTIADDVVRDNDRGVYARRLTGECAPQGFPEGGGSRASLPVSAADLRGGGCGEALHLASTSDSRVLDNIVRANTGGIYLTDESAPAAHDLVAGNRVTGNVLDCGITLASHSQRAVSPGGVPQPSVAGIYDNTIRDNIADDNGRSKPGTGILIAAAFPGSGAWDNRIVDNEASGNGLPGIALHSHTRRQLLDGTVISGNVVGRNGIGAAGSGPGDADAGVDQTVGILAWTDTGRLSRTRIEGNVVSDDYYGIWTEGAPHIRRRSNAYTDTRIDVWQR